MGVDKALSRSLLNALNKQLLFSYMPSPSPKLEWCVARFGDDMNWWVSEISDEIHWDVDGLSILDPRQIGHIIELCDPLREYGFDPDILENAFYSFRIEKEVGDQRIRLVRTNETILDSEDPLFALPDIMDEERGPYAEFIDQITRFRVKMLNDLIDFDQNLTIDELEEEIRERHNSDYFEGVSIHYFNEITAILEYVPDGYELDSDDDAPASDDEDIDDIPDFEEDESIEEDETMKWDEDEEEDDEDDDDGMLDEEEDDDDED